MTLTASMSIIRRSTTGCWTCRARRKKCDESGRPCSICKALCLTCHGYGARPDWMNGGVQEKAHMAAFKAIVKRSKTQNRREGSSPIFFDMNATSPKKRVFSYLVTRTSSITNTLQRSTVVTIDEALRNAEYDAGLNLDGALGWLDPVYDPQPYAIDFSDISLDPEQHDRSHDALSPLSTETLDRFRTSLTRTVMDDVPFEKLTDDSMQTLPLNHAIAMSASQPASQ